ncbi:tetratricopeptide repeat-containing sulfotransferase family protein [Cohaesibacter haloalkalitolerans]|uniref:tetratricopeptide repeat-containing sulfotransferase family protein n=1 Tax=Cohaesibacter haloalkalitolerans TaxID=1162980 RepID=UPI0013C46CAC|nr:tetratricopeptide repeat-containing sulfotransferase family protein [Cohaesibacter haloalkalitolerans]
MTLTIDEALAAARLAQQNGKLQEAERLLSQALKAHPDHPEANHCMGSLAIAVAKPAEALPFFGVALKANPQNARHWLSYVDTLLQLDMTDEARRAIDTAGRFGIAANQFAFFEARLPDTGREPGKEKEEGETTGKPGEARALNNAQLNRQLKLASKKAKSGARQEAINIYSGILAIYPKNKRALDGLAQLGVTVNANANAAGKVDPPAERLTALTMLIENGQFGEAQQAAATLRQSFPNSIVLLNIEGTAFARLNRHDKAIACFRAALAINPASARVHYYLGAALEDAGDLAAAHDSFTEALRLDPGDVGTHCQLAAIKRFTEGDPQIAAMETLLTGKALSDSLRSRLSFALAKAYEDVGALDKSFRHLKQANALRSRLLGYDAAQDRELFANIYKYHALLEANPAEVPASDRSPAGEPVPIFIVGMPRSGTTLVEQILSAHSSIKAAGEVELMSQLGTAITREQSLLSCQTIRDFRAMYKSTLRDRAGGGAFITDKLPQNFRYINLIARIFPEARVIHVERDPFATCWSNYKQNFVTNDLGYCYDLEDIVAYYALYRELMDFWFGQYADRIYRLDYERLVRDQETETRKLAAHVGLDWEVAMLSPQDNSRIARTASQQQVRKGVYKGSSGQWRKFEPFLAGAFEPLGQYCSESDDSSRS